MEGGINAWDGLKAAGPPESGMVIFSDKTGPEDLIEIAWMLEEGAHRFYKGVENLIDDQDTKKIFASLSTAEVNHKALLVRLYKELPNTGDIPEFLESSAAKALHDVMESGLHISEALKWAEGKSLAEVLEYSIAFEANSYDLYIKMERKMTEEHSKEVFRTLLNEEKKHLTHLTSLLKEH